MSFQEKIGQLMQRPGQDVVPKDDVPWWMKYSGRILGTVGGALAIIFGLFTCTGILFGGVTAVVAGVWQMLAGFAVMLIEAPCCCLFLDFVQSISDFVDKRPYWNRAAFYVLISIPAIVLDFSFSTFAGSGLIFGTGVIYGMMALGKKASFEEMRSNANAATNPQQPGEVPNPNMKASLVNNAAPYSFTGSPSDSNV